MLKRKRLDDYPGNLIEADVVVNMDFLVRMRTYIYLILRKSAARAISNTTSSVKFCFLKITAISQAQDLEY
jgi:hypothetical protein